MEIYIDESGHANKLYEGQDGPRYFTLSAIATSDPSRTANVAVDTMNTHGIDNELKYGKSTEKAKRRFAEKFSNAAGESYIEGFSVALDRKSIPASHKFEEINIDFTFYQIASGVCSALFDDLEQKGSLKVYFDKCWTKSERRRNLNSTLEKLIQENCSGFHSMEFNHVDSRREKNIQVADMIAGFSREYIENGYKGIYFENHLSDHVTLETGPFDSLDTETLISIIQTISEKQN